MRKLLAAIVIFGIAISTGAAELTLRYGRRISRRSRLRRKTRWRHWRARPPQGEKAVASQAIAWIRTKAFRRLDIYVEGKHIHSRGELIDFNETAPLIGISFSFRL